MKDYTVRVSTSLLTGISPENAQAPGEILLLLFHFFLGSKVIFVFWRRGREHRNKDRGNEDGRWRSTAASLADDNGAQFFFFGDQEEEQIEEMMSVPMVVQSMIPEEEKRNCFCKRLVGK